MRVVTTLSDYSYLKKWNQDTCMHFKRKNRDAIAITSIYEFSICVFQFYLFMGNITAF